MKRITKNIEKVRRITMTLRCIALCAMLALMMPQAVAQSSEITDFEREEADFIAQDMEAAEVEAAELEANPLNKAGHNSVAADDDGISEADTFTAPPGMNLDLGCTGGDDDARETAEQKEAEAYFD